MSVVGANARMLYERETPYGLISVSETSDGLYTWMRQNNHYVLGATRGADSELRQGYVPLLLHPRPRRVCFLGLATGITASSALGFPGVEGVTAVELIPQVVEAAKHFAPYNGGIPGNYANIAYAGFSRYKGTAFTYDNFLLQSHALHTECGDWGYLDGDVDQDCDVDFHDLMAIALEWLNTTDFADFAELADDWMKCTDPLGDGCIDVR